MSDSASTSILANYQRVLSEISAATATANRPAGAVQLVAVSKTYGVEAVRVLLEAGHRVFGENRVQEAFAKWPTLKAEYPDIELHLIGPLQTNKVKEALGLFDVIETVDRPRLAQALAKEMARSGQRPRLLAEVNTGAEPQKAGILPSEAEDFVRACHVDWGLAIDGLMCIPPFDQDPAPHFTTLAGLARRCGLSVLSMGMSADFATGVACGATHVRVGTAIFGARA